MKNVLLLEDEGRIRQLYVRLLTAVGLYVLEAENADQATQVLVKHPLDLVLLDLNIPQINGQEMFDIIKEYNPDLKVITFSASSVNQQKRLVPFADDYFDKSDGPYTLLERIDQVLFSSQDQKEILAKEVAK